MQNRFRGSAGIRSILEKLFHTDGNLSLRLLSCLSFSFTDFLFKELIVLLSRNEKYTNTQTKIRQHQIFYFFKFYHKVFVIFLNYLFFTSWLTSAKKLNQNLSLDWNPEVELAVKQGETAGSMSASEGWKAS